MISFEQALTTVRQKLQAAARKPLTERLGLLAARGRILAEDVSADRDYPPFHRSTRDGFAVHAGDAAAVPATLKIAGLARAGAPFTGQVAAGCAVEIMTGAPLPEGTDAVVMVEHTRQVGPIAPGGSGLDARVKPVEIIRPVAPGENVIRQGSEAPAGSVVLPRGRRLGPGEIGLAASIGRTELQVFARPRVAILPTGDEVVPVDQRPEWFQIRNS
ncbi:MAG TPA: molybdopterin molybdotransferase MoeA, partial [Terriglobia bacterium]